MLTTEEISIPSSREREAKFEGKHILFSVNNSRKGCSFLFGIGLTEYYIDGERVLQDEINEAANFISEEYSSNNEQ